MTELFKLLSIKSTDFRAVPGGFGSMTQADVCHAMGGLNKIETLYVYGILLHTDVRAVNSDLAEFHRHLSSHLKRLLPCRQQKAEKLAACCIAKAKAGITCTRCNGHGDYLTAAGRRKECSRCQGSGIMRFRDSDLAKIAAVSVDNWAGNYRKQYAEAEKYTESIRGRVFAHLKRKSVTQSA